MRLSEIAEIDDRISISRNEISKVFEKWWNGEELTFLDRENYYSYRLRIQRAEAYRGGEKIHEDVSTLAMLTQFLYD